VDLARLLGRHGQIAVGMARQGPDNLFRFEAVLMLVSMLGAIDVGLLILLVRAIMRVAP